VTPKFGSTQLAIRPGGSTAIVGTFKELGQLLAGLRAATERGELDVALAVAASSVGRDAELGDAGGQRRLPMSIVDTLSLGTAGERTKGYDPVRLRRKKLAGSLDDQLRLLAAVEAGERYRKVKVRRQRDLETDEAFEVEQQRRVSPWWWVEDDGSVRFSIRYGSTRIELREGKDAIVLKSLDELKAVIPALRQEVLAGGFDGQLAAAAGQLQGRFKLRKKGKA